MKDEYPLYKTYRVELVKADSDHRLADRVEDEEELFVTCGNKFWQASEFFYCEEVSDFLVKEETRNDV